MNADDGATPLDPDESEGLIPKIGTRDDLNLHEFANIAKGRIWAEKSREMRFHLLSVDALRLLHRQMFGDVWIWAGKFRTTEKSIGVAPFQIPPDLRNLVDDVQVWIETGSVAPQEAAARFHHRLVWIHPFPNGNGRFARAATELLCRNQGWPTPTWQLGMGQQDALRQDYLAALRQADARDLSALIQFIW